MNKNVLTEALLSAIEGTTPISSCEKLAELAATVPSGQCVVEIGVYKGRTLCYLADGTHRGHRVPVFGVDTWDLPGLGGKHRVAKKFAEQAIVRHGFHDMVVLLQGFSVDVARKFHGPPIGLLFVDGDHTEAGVLTDIHAWYPHLAENATVVFDDYGGGRNPGVGRAVQKSMHLFDPLIGRQGLMAILRMKAISNDR
jgi:hypothetical protein